MTSDKHYLDVDLRDSMKQKSCIRLSMVPLVHISALYLVLTILALEAQSEEIAAIQLISNKLNKHDNGNTNSSQTINTTVAVMVTMMILIIVVLYHCVMACSGVAPRSWVRPEVSDGLSRLIGWAKNHFNNLQLIVQTNTRSKQQHFKLE